MLPEVRSSLALRMIILAGTGLFAAFALFAGLSTWTVDEAMQRTLEERRILARAVADRVAYLIQHNLDTLQEVSVAAQFGPGRAEVTLPRPALHDVYLRTIFSGGVYLLDANGEVLLAEPAAQVTPTAARQPYVTRALEAGKPVVSDVYYAGPSSPPLLSALIPVRNDLGDVVGLLGGDVHATDRRLEEIVHAIAIGGTGYVQLVDSTGKIIAGRGAGQPPDPAPRYHLADLVLPRQAGVGTYQGCHDAGGGLACQDEVIGFAPVSGAPWAVLVRQAAVEALLPANRLRQITLFAGLPLFLISLAVAWATARSVVRPLGLLARSAAGIAGGDLRSPVPALGEDEIGHLARTFEQMRLRLQDSHQHIQGWNAELEERVRQRTLQLEEQENVRRELLRKVISAQEEERRRIARELHDDTSQSLAALIVAVETAALAVATAEPALQRLTTVRSLAVQILDGVHELIFDLRPSLLDDLGLVAALRWYAESRLQPAGLDVSVETSGAERRLPPEVETTLFRALQEAITNVVRHAGAETVVLRLEMPDDLVVAEVEDDGRGFDPAAVHREPGKMGGLGLLGMAERIGLLKGQMAVVSRPGHGTRVRFEVPIAMEGLSSGDNSRALSR